MADSGGVSNSDAKEPTSNRRVSQRLQQSYEISSKLKDSLFLSAAKQQPPYNDEDLNDEPKIWHVGDDPIWQPPIQEEITSLKKAGTFVEVHEDELTPEQKKGILDSTFTLKRKRDARGCLARLKARLVARGDQLLDAIESYAPTPRQAMMRLIFFLIAVKNLFALQADVKAAFVRADLLEPVFIRPCRWARAQPGIIWKCVKSLYGLPQAGRNWFLLLKRILEDYGLTQSKNDKCLFYGKGLMLIVLFHVDDLIIGGTQHKVEALMHYLQSKLPITATSHISQYLGAAINVTHQAIFISCPAFIRACAVRFGLTDRKPVATPIIERLEPRRPEEPLANVKRMQGIVGCLLWICRLCRPDIAYAVHELTMHASNPSPRHLKAAERVLVYLYHTANYGVSYSRQSSIADLRVFCDADFHRIGDRKPVTGIVTMIGNAIIDWSCKSQTAIATSTFDAEIHAASEAAKEAIYWTNVLEELQARTAGIVPLYEDNQAVVNFAKRFDSNDDTKHLSAKFHHLKELVQQEVIQIVKVESVNNVSDILTKVLGRSKFVRLRNMLGVVECPEPQASS